jgi:hypothetical protein
MVCVNLRPARRLVTLALAAVLLLPSALHSQNLSSGSINGTVTDETGAALPGVTVTAASPALQVQQVTTVTDEEGRYRLIDLPRGTYQLRYELSGFRPLAARDSS